MCFCFDCSSCDFGIVLSIGELCVKMAGLFEYDKKRRKYMKDMKTGKRWRVKGLGKK